MHPTLLQRLRAVHADAGRALIVALSVALVAGLPAVASAGEPVRLHWVRLAGTGSCIDAQALEARVRERLGSDPFDARATRAIEGVVRRSGGTWAAEIAVRARGSDAEPPSRELKSQAADCSALSDAVVLAVALAIDPAAALSAPPRSAPPKPPPVPPAAAAMAPPPRSPGVSGRADVGIVAQAGLLPHASLGAGLVSAAAVSRRLEIAVGVELFPAVDAPGSPPYTIGLARGSAEMCVRLAHVARLDLHGCGGPSAGLVDAALLMGDRAQPGQRFWLGADAGVEAAVAVSRSFAMRLGVAGVVPLTRYRFSVDGTDATLFRQRAVAGTAQADLELRFGSGD